MEVNTGAFTALTEQIAGLEAKLAELHGYHLKVAENVARLMARAEMATWDSPAIRGRRPGSLRRPRHLHVARDGDR